MTITTVIHSKVLENFGMNFECLNLLKLCYAVLAVRFS